MINNENSIQKGVVSVLFCVLTKSKHSKIVVLVLKCLRNICRCFRQCLEVFGKSLEIFESHRDVFGNPDHDNVKISLS